EPPEAEEHRDDDSHHVHAHVVPRSCVVRRTDASRSPAYRQAVPPPDPLIRIETVARGLGALGRELEEYLGADARRGPAALAARAARGRRGAALDASRSAVTPVFVAQVAQAV